MEKIRTNDYKMNFNNFTLIKVADEAKGEKDSIYQETIQRIIDLKEEEFIDVDEYSYNSLRIILGSYLKRNNIDMEIKTKLLSKKKRRITKVRNGITANI